MKKYTVTIEETVTQDFEIDAESAEAAISAAQEKYWNGEIVLEPGEVQKRRIKLTDAENCFDWEEF